MSPDVRETFLRYFSEGMTNATARNYHEMMLETRYEAESSKLPFVLANAQLNPTERQVKHLYEKWRWVIFNTTRIRDSIVTNSIHQKCVIMHINKHISYYTTYLLVTYQSSSSRLKIKKLRLKKKFIKPMFIWTFLLPLSV